MLQSHCPQTRLSLKLYPTTPCIWLGVILSVSLHAGGCSGTVTMADDSLLQDVLHYIQREWPFMTGESCIPVQVALQLMDSSSLGRAHQFDQFQVTHKQLQIALRGIVNGRSSFGYRGTIRANITLEYHQGFNSSMATFHNIQSGIHSSQNRVRSLRDGLALAKSGLSTTKPELKGLAASSQEYEDMLQILNQM